MPVLPERFLQVQCQGWCKGLRLPVNAVGAGNSAVQPSCCVQFKAAAVRFAAVQCGQPTHPRHAPPARRRRLPGAEGNKMVGVCCVGSPACGRGRRAGCTGCGTDLRNALLAVRLLRALLADTLPRRSQPGPWAHPACPPAAGPRSSGYMPSRLAGPTRRARWPPLPTAWPEPSG